MHEATTMATADQNLFRSVVERIGDLIPFGFWLADARGELTYASASFLEMTGAALDECVGLGWTRYVHPQDRARTTRRWLECVRDGSHFSREHRIRGRDGAYFNIRSRAMPLRHDLGQEQTCDQLRGWAGVNLDVTDRHRFVAEVRAARNTAEAASRAKDELVLAVSHELRNPLTPVLAGAQMIERDTSLPDETRACARMIRANAELEARLIDDLLDLTRLLRGKVDVTFEATDVHALVSNVLEICRGQAADKGVRLAASFDAVNARVRGDGARLQQALWSLVRNGIQATPRGGEVRICTRTDAGELAIRVEDGGPGIDPERLAGLFAAPGSAAGEHGFGLALAKAIVDMHEGRITAKSRCGGASLEIHLATAMTQETPSASRPSAVPERRITILFVDDHRDTCALITSMLTRRGYHVLTAEDVGSALRVADEHDFDLLVSDLGLPDASGLDLILELRKRRPVLGIAITGFGRDEDIRRCKEAGFVEHMTKPINLPVLEATIRRLTSAAPVA
jgi:PAS domain S-box-containing protein